MTALALVLGCGSESSNDGGSGGEGGTGGGTVRTCATDIDIGEVQAFGTPTPTTTEGITFDATGRMFVSANYRDADDQLLEILSDGSNELRAEAESILGLQSDPRGILAAGFATGELLLIDPDAGTHEVLADGLGAPNFVVTTPWGTILVSDDSPGDESPGKDTIYEVTWDGQVSIWLRGGVPTPNGMVFSLDASTLYVAATFTEPGLWRVPVDESGTAGTPEYWIPIAADTLTPADGLTIDTEGNVYMAINIPINGIVKVSPDGVVTPLAEGVASAASLAFGQGDFDPCSLYVTSLLGTQLWRVGTGVLGLEN